MAVAQKSLVSSRYLLLDEIIPSERAQLFQAKNMESGSRQSSRTDKARVFQAIDIETRDMVALKLLEPWSTTSRQMTARFSREIATLQKLSHENIVRFYGYGTTGINRPYYVMELLRGKTLGDRLAESGPIPVDELADYLDQIASAIDTAHQRGVIHRDINPYNIMLHEDEFTGRTVVKLLDFGLAKLSAEESRDSGLTGAGTALGSPAYMSPEQARGETLNGRTDIYSLGATLFEAMTGEVLYPGKTEIEVMLSHASKPFPGFPSDWTGHHNVTGLESVVASAVAKLPSDRPSTATELANRFRQAIEQPSSSASLAKPVLRRRWLTIGAAVSVTLAGLIGFWALGKL